ncbi:MAG: hypothetical protein IIC73_05270 [Armatimonadetes bacterium]|nr:hypothetical protein [Armatimonadota bacterium]
MAKVSRPLVYGAVLVVAVAAFVMTTPKNAEDGDGPGPRRGARSTAGPPTGIFDYDYDAKFEPLNESPENAFMPLVARTRRNSGGIEPNEFPPAFAGGESGWFYTGTVIIDDVPSALVENELTGDGMFLKVGENLKRTMISEITPTYIVVTGTTGRSLRLDLLRDLPEPGDEFEGLVIEPVRPDLDGVLGGPIRLPESPDTSEQS